MNGLFQIFQYPVELLLAHGYTALFLWSVLEGEIGLMLAGWLASTHRVFQYGDVVTVAILGGLLGDLIVFWTGRLFEKRVRRWFAAHPRKERRVREWLRRWGPLVIVFERFIYGTHIPVLLSIGMSGYSFWRFFLFDIVGIVLWAFTFVTVGYLFGQHVIELILFAQKNLFLVLFLLLVSFTLFLVWQEDEDEEKDAK
jgi:membrane protein DedA with SNARE-associated domain